MSDNKFHINSILGFLSLCPKEKEESRESLMTLIENINSNRDKLLTDGYYKSKVGKFQGTISFKAAWGGYVGIYTRIKCYIYEEGSKRPKVYSFQTEGSLKEELETLYEYPSL